LLTLYKALPTQSLWVKVALPTLFLKPVEMPAVLQVEVVPWLVSTHLELSSRPTVALVVVVVVARLG
jgi:hypothetical protein